MSFAVSMLCLSSNTQAVRKSPTPFTKPKSKGRPTRDNVARQAVDEAISKSFTLKDFDRQLAEMGYRINLDPNRKYWTIIGKGWQRPKRLYKLGEEYTNDRIMERISENSYAVKFQSFSEPRVKVYRVKGSLKNARKSAACVGCISITATSSVSCQKAENKIMHGFIIS